MYSYYNGYISGQNILLHKDEYDSINDNYTEQYQIQENLTVTTDLFVEFDTTLNQYKFYKDIDKQVSLGTQPTIYRGYIYSFTGISLENTKPFNVGSGYKENINHVDVKPFLILCLMLFLVKQLIMIKTKNMACTLVNICCSTYLSQILLLL